MSSLKSFSELFMCKRTFIYLLTIGNQFFTYNFLSKEFYISSTLIFSWGNSSSNKIELLTRYQWQQSRPFLFLTWTFPFLH